LRPLGVDTRSPLTSVSSLSSGSIGSGAGGNWCSQGGGVVVYHGARRRGDRCYAQFERILAKGAAYQNPSVNADSLEI
jgi:hypothetical protein